MLLGLLGISAAVALAGITPVRASTFAVLALDGPTCPTPQQPVPSVTLRPQPSATGPANATPLDSALDCARPNPTPGATGTVRAGQPLPRITVEPGQPVVAATPANLTGSTVTMIGLRFEGIVDLPTLDGTLKAVKFSMERAVIHDFLLCAPGSADSTVRFASDRLTVSGNVSFYATRLVGWLFGVKIMVAPDLPLPDGMQITSSIPITFSDPAIDLAFVSSDTLAARPALRVAVG